MTWLAVVAYALVVLVPLRPVAGHFAWRFHRAEQEKYSFARDRRWPTGEQWFGAFLLAGLLLSLWPLTGVVWLSGRRLPSLGAEREAELDRLRKRNRELERELG
jgi:hypothetical protein